MDALIGHSLPVKLCLRRRAVPRCSAALLCFPSQRCSVSYLSDVAQASLCVRRAVYVDPETGKEDPAKKVGGRQRANVQLLNARLSNVASCVWEAVFVRRSQRDLRSAAQVSCPRICSPGLPPPLHRLPLGRASAPTSCAMPSPARRSP